MHLIFLKLELSYIYEIILINHLILYYKVTSLIKLLEIVHNSNFLNYYKNYIKYLV